MYKTCKLVYITFHFPDCTDLKHQRCPRQILHQRRLTSRLFCCLWVAKTQQTVKSSFMLATREVTTSFRTLSEASRPKLKIHLPKNSHPGWKGMISSLLKIASWKLPLPKLHWQRHLNQTLDTLTVHRPWTLQTEAFVRPWVLPNEKVRIPSPVTHASENNCTGIIIHTDASTTAKKRNTQNDSAPIDWQSGLFTADPQDLDGHGLLYTMDLWLQEAKAIGGALKIILS